MGVLATSVLARSVARPLLRPAFARLLCSTPTRRSAWPSEGPSANQPKATPSNLPPASRTASTWNPDGVVPAPSLPPAKNMAYLATLKAKGEPIAAMTAYDYPGALACRGSDVDVVLVGDSVANVVYGYERTSDLSIEEMIVSIRAVARALRSPALTHSPYAPPMLLADLVYGTYESSTKDGVQAAIGLIRAGADGIKVEGGAEALELISALGEYGVPVMAHIGLRPQRAPALTGFRVQGGSASAALQVVQDAIMAQEAGASALLVEAVPQVVGAEVSRQVKIPVVGIGAGPDTDGQILVQHDVLGDLTSPAAVLPPRFQNSTAGFGVPLAHELTPTPARFVRLFTDQAPSTAASAPEFPAACRLTVGAARLHAIASYVAAVKDRSFPAAPEVYKMRKEERAQFDELIADLIKADADVSK